MGLKTRVECKTDRICSRSTAAVLARRGGREVPDVSSAFHSTSGTRHERATTRDEGQRRLHSAGRGAPADPPGRSGAGQRARRLALTSTIPHRSSSGPKAELFRGLARPLRTWPHQSSNNVCGWRNSATLYFAGKGTAALKKSALSAVAQSCVDLLCWAGQSSVFSLKSGGLNTSPSPRRVACPRQR